MTTRKVNRKPAAKPAAKPFDVIAAAKIIGDNIGQADAAKNVLGDATAKINEQVKAMRGAKVKLGASRRTCPNAKAVYDAMPEHLKQRTKENYLSAIRAAVNGKADFQFPNGSAKAKAAKGKKGAKATGGTIMIAIGSGATDKDAAAKLRAGFNKMKAANDNLAKVAAFLIDALDDAGYTDDAE